MTKMDDRDHPDFEIYVEDERAKTWIIEILSRYSPESVLGSAVIPYGKANLGMALGQLVNEKRLPRPTAVFLDGDQDKTSGCELLPGEDAPERVIFARLKEKNWLALPERVGRDYADVAEACQRAMTLPNHHEWVRATANHLRYPGDTLWLAMCAEWVKTSEADEVQHVLEHINAVSALAQTQS